MKSISREILDSQCVLWKYGFPRKPHAKPGMAICQKPAGQRSGGECAGCQEMRSVLDVRRWGGCWVSGDEESAGCQEMRTVLDVRR